MTTVRFCPKCRADVEDVGGFFLLGHRFAATPAEDPLADLRAEVDQAFQKVQAEVAVALGPIESLATENVAAGDPRPDEELLEEIQVTSKALWASLEEDVEVSGTDPIAAFAPSPRMDWGPDDSKHKRRSGIRRSRPNPA